MNEQAPPSTSAGAGAPRELSADVPTLKPAAPATGDVVGALLAGLPTLVFTMMVASALAVAVFATYTVADVQQLARTIVGSGAQYQCFSNIVDHESSWNYQATNPSSGAYGLMQALPAGKYASAGADWRTNPATQIKWGLNYMNERYGSPCDAWSFWQANRWY